MAERAKRVTVELSPASVRSLNLSAEVTGRTMRQTIEDALWLSDQIAFGLAHGAVLRLHLPGGKVEQIAARLPYVEAVANSRHSTIPSSSFDHADRGDTSIDDLPEPVHHVLA